MKKLIAIMILSVISTFNAVYLTIKAYGVRANEASGSSFCDISETFSCSNVFVFDFSWLFWIPFPAIAMIVYPVIFIIALLGYLWKIKNHFTILLAMAIGGLLFNGNIIFHEIQVMTFCLLCLMCTVFIASIWVMSYIWMKDEQKKLKK